MIPSNTFYWYFAYNRSFGSILVFVFVSLIRKSVVADRHNYIAVITLSPTLPVVNFWIPVLYHGILPVKGRVIKMDPPRHAAAPRGVFIHPDQDMPVFYKKYVYKPLAPRMIRLIRLSDWNSNPIRSRGVLLKHFLLEERSIDDPSLSYVALSYAWGSGDKDSSLTFHDSTGNAVIMVTQTAWEAVNMLAPVYSLWVDQISINQDDKDEKSQQIAMMGDIYSRCWNCAIWLGAADKHTAEAFGFLRRLALRIPDSETIAIQLGKLIPYSHAKIRDVLIKEYGVDRLPPANDKGWRAFAQCLCRLWYSRLWTFQEAVLAPKDSVVVCCGVFHSTLKAFTRAAYFLGNEHEFGAQHSNGRTQLNQVLSYQHRVQNGLPRPIAMLLDNTGFYDCSVPRDRIYALLGIRSEEDNLLMAPITVNLRQPCDELYIEVTRKIVSARSSLLVCTQAPGRTGGKVANLPSWVPDWSARPGTNMFEFFDPTGHQFRADKLRRWSEAGGQSQRQLMVNGGIVDAVAEIVESDPPDAVTDEKRKAYLQETLPLLFGLLCSAPNAAKSSHMLRIINTIRINGYVGKWIPASDDFLWDPAIIQTRFGTILSLSPGQRLPETVNIWLLALAAQAHCLANRRFALLDKHYFGLVPKDARAGDHVAILHGLTLPVILRSKDYERYELVGACFVDGIMFGEATTWSERNARRFCIV